MLDDILNATNLYAQGLKNVKERRTSWQEKHKELKEHLKVIADELNATAAYKPGFFVDTLHAFNEEINGICKEMTSVTLRCGDMPMLVTFHNSIGEKKEYTEEGFRISFIPSVTGEIMVLLYAHHSELDKNAPKVGTLAIIPDPSGFTMDMADEIIAKGIEMAFYTSFTGMAEVQDENEKPGERKEHPHNPIGFKRYETTEKVG